MNEERKETDVSQRDDLNKHAKTGKAVKAVASVTLAGCLVASLGLNIYQARQSSSQNRKVNKFIDNQLERQAKEEEQENTYQEDGYKVGNQYEIRSTTHISDAYKSGDDSKLKEEDKETLQMASDVLKKIIKDGMNSYEKELAVYQWMFKNVGQGHGSSVTLPGSNDSAFTPHGALSGQSTVCVGYATTFRLFMNMLDMDCHIVHNEYHSWDMVQLDDNEWYQVDVYSDVSGRCQYQNFNMTDEISRSSHDWDGSAFFKFKKPLRREQLPIADLLLNQMNMALSSLPGFDNYTMGGMWYQDEQDQYILGIFIHNYGETDTPSFDENSPEAKKMLEAVTKAFEVELPEATESTQATDVIARKLRTSDSVSETIAVG